ncbi:MAG: transporter [Pseudomonadales bacterium]
MLRRPVVSSLIVLLVVASPARANDVLPRLFANVPVDTSYVGLSYTLSEGNVAVDPALALDVDATLHTVMFTYSHAFAAFGQSALVTAALPVADLTLSGIVGGTAVTASDRELSDPRLKFTYNLAGAPALTLAEFGGYRQKTIIGFDLEVSLPLGDYDETRRVNFGSNRWTFSPQLGFSHRFRRISVEGSLTGIFFSDNDEYLVNHTLKQNPIGMVRANLLYHFRRPGTWLGVSALYLNGGETSVDGEKRADLQSNSRLGASLSVPFARRHTLLFKFSSGVTTRIGADFDNYQVQYTLRF